MITWLDKIDGFDLGDPQKNVTADDMNQIKNEHNTLETAVTGFLSATDFVYGEILSGTVNGVNTVFNFAFTPVSGKIAIYLDVRLRVTTHYTMTGPSEVTFVVAPIVGEVPIADYIKA